MTKGKNSPVLLGQQAAKRKAGGRAQRRKAEKIAAKLRAKGYTIPTGGLSK